MQAINNQRIQVLGAGPAPVMPYANSASASMLDQFVREESTVGVAAFTYRPKTNAEWLVTVDELIEKASEEIRNRETLGRLAFLHSQITNQRANGEDINQDMVAEYAVLAA